MNKGQSWVGGKYIEYMPDPSVDPYEVRPEDGYDCWAETTTTGERHECEESITPTEQSSVAHQRLQTSYKRPCVTGCAVDIPVENYHRYFNKKR